MPISYRGYGEISYGDTNSTLGAFGVYVFPPTYTLTFNVKPVMSDNGISVKYNRNELTINWVLPYEMIFSRFNPGATPVSVDTAVQQIKAILMQPGKTLTCAYQGLGPVSSPTTAGMTITANTDKAGGPLPLDFKWKVLATQRCVEMSWTVAFHTTNCITFNENNEIVFAAPESATINEFIWSRSYDLDENGLATITTTGRIERSDYGPGKHIDQWRVLAAFKVPVYCQRISQKFQHDPTTRTTSFTLVDKEFSSTENALPPLVQNMDLSHEISSALLGGGKLSGTGFYSWNNTFSGNITLAPNVPPVYAYFLFHFYLRQRMYRVHRPEDNVSEHGVASTTTKVKVRNEKGEVKEAQDVRALLTRISYKESLFNRTHSFKAEYYALYDREKLIGQSGIFLPLYNYTQGSEQKEYKHWFNGLKSDLEPWKKTFDRSNEKADNKIYSQFLQRYLYHAANLNLNNPYGYLFFKDNPSSGANIFIPCDSQDILASTNANSQYIPDLLYAQKDAWNIETTVDVAEEYKRPADVPMMKSIRDDNAVSAYVDPNKSWIAYENNIAIVENHNTAQVVRQSYDNNIKIALQSYLGQDKPTKTSTNFSINNAGTSEAITPPTGEVVTTYNGQSNMVVILSGYAIRAGFPCPMPSVLSYRDNPVYRAGQAAYSNRIISHGEIPVYLATWSIPYYIDYTKHENVFQKLVVNGYSGDFC